MLPTTEKKTLGKFSKTLGYQGELLLILDQLFDFEMLDEIFVMIDGLDVPFPLEEFDLRTDTTAVVKLEFIDTLEQASELVGREVLTDIAIEVEEPESEEWIGYTVYDVRHGEIGIIQAIEDFNGNIVMQIRRAKEEFLIAYFPELIAEVNVESKTIYINAPDGYF